MKKIAMMAMISVLLMAVLPAAAYSVSFSDVSSAHWAADSIADAVARSYVNGYPDGTFQPEKEVTRAEFLRMLVDALQLPHSQGGSPWYQPFVASALETGIHDPADFTAYNEPISRLEIVRLAARGLARNPTYKTCLDLFGGLYNADLPFVDYRDIAQNDVPYMALVFGTGIVSGYPDASFGMEKNATRAEAVTMINRLLNTRLKSPDHFQYLNELKEVAETGMNATTVSDLIPQINLQKEQPVVEHKNFTAKFKRLYVIPVEGDTVSLYERKYLWDREELPTQFITDNTRGYVVGVADVTFKVSGSDELYRPNLYLSPKAFFYYQEAYKHFKFMYPYMKDAYDVSKGMRDEIVFYGIYSKDDFQDIRIQCNDALFKTDGYELLKNPDKVLPPVFNGDSL